MDKNINPQLVIRQWVSRISKRNQNLGGHKICSFARMPKVVEVNKLSVEQFVDLKNEITVYMENSVNSSYDEIESLCRTLKRLYPDYVFLPDHPHRINYINGHKTGNGVFPCIIVQTKQELDSARSALEKTDYYNYWDKSYLSEIKSFD